MSTPLAGGRATLWSPVQSILHKEDQYYEENLLCSDVNNIALSLQPTEFDEHPIII